MQKDKAAGMPKDKYIKFLRHSYFDKDHANRYDDWKKIPHSFYLEKRQRHCFTLLLEAESSECTLDLGCGTGKYLEVLAGTSRFVIGVDFSIAFLKKAQKKCKRVGLYSRTDLILCDILNLPFRKSLFTRVICINTLQYIVDANSFFREISRLSKDSATVIIDGLCKTELRLGYPILNLRNLIRRLFKKKPIGLYRNYYTHWGLKRTLKDAGLDPVRTLGCAIYLPLITKDYIGITVPSPHHIFYLFPRLYKYWESIEERIKEYPPLSYLGTHILVKAIVCKGVAK